MDVARTVAGLRFGVPGSGTQAERFASMASRMGDLTPIGHLLQSPQFTTLPELQKRLEEIEVSGDGSQPSLVYDERRSSVVWVLPNRQFAEPFVRACGARKLTPVGRMDTGATGRTMAHVVIANPEYTVPLAHAHEDDVMLGVHWWNATRTGHGAGGEVFGVRMVCLNYNLWGNILGRFRLTQLESPDAILDRYDKLLQLALDRSPHLRGLIESAKDTLVVAEDVPDLLWGIGLPPEGIASLSQSIERWAPDVRRDGLNAWTLYNAATAYVTWGMSHARDPTLVDSCAERASELLTTSHDRLIARGRGTRGLASEDNRDARVRAIEMRIRELAIDGRMEARPVVVK